MTTPLASGRTGRCLAIRRLALLALGGGLTLTALSGNAARAQAQNQNQYQRLQPFNGQPGDPAGGQRGGPQLTPAQQQQVFPGWRSLALQGAQARQVILQKQQQCLSAATNLQALKTCMREERQAMGAQRQAHREQMQQLFQRYGIPLPQRLQGEGQSRWGGAPQGGPGGGQ